MKYKEGKDFEWRKVEGSNAMSRHFFTSGEKAQRAAATAKPTPRQAAKAVATQRAVVPVNKTPRVVMDDSQDRMAARTRQSLGETTKPNVIPVQKAKFPTGASVRKNNPAKQPKEMLRSSQRTAPLPDPVNTRVTRRSSSNPDYYRNSGGKDIDVKHTPRGSATADFIRNRVQANLNADKKLLKALGVSESGKPSRRRKSGMNK